MRKTVGIVVDNYKVESMKEALEKQNFKIESVSSFGEVTTTIKVETVSKKLYELKDLIKEVDRKIKS